MTPSPGSHYRTLRIVLRRFLTLPEPFPRPLFFITPSTDIASSLMSRHRRSYVVRLVPVLFLASVPWLLIFPLALPEVCSPPLKNCPFPANTTGQSWVKGPHPLIHCHYSPRSFPEEEPRKQPFNKVFLNHWLEFPILQPKPALNVQHELSQPPHQAGF